MKKSILVLSAVLTAVTMNISAFTVSANIMLPGSVEIIGTPAEARFAEKEDQLLTDMLYDTQAAENINYFSVPLGSDATTVTGHNIAADGDALKMEMTDEVPSEYISNPEIKENFSSQPPNINCKTPRQRVEWKKTNAEAVWYGMNGSDKSGDVYIQTDSPTSGAKITTYSGSAFLGCEIKPAYGKGFAGIKSAYADLFVQNFGYPNDEKYAEIKYFVDKTFEKYIGFGVDGERKPYYSIDGERTFVPNSAGWAEFDNSNDIKNNARNITVEVEIVGNTFKFEFNATGQYEFEQSTWNGTFSVEDLSTRAANCVYAQAFDTTTSGNIVNLHESKLVYLSSSSSQSFALGYGNKNDATGKAFGITSENAANSSIKFDVKLSDNSIKETLKLSVGYNGNGSIGTHGTFSNGVSPDFSQEATDGWYSITIPASQFMIEEGFEIDKANLLKFNFGADFNKRAGKKIWIKNVRLERAAKGDCYVKYILYDTATKAQVALPSDINNKSLSLAVEWNNEKSYAEAPLFIVAIYDDKGFMNDIKAVNFNVAGQTKSSDSAELFSVPNDGKRYSIGVYLIDGFTVSKPYGDGIILK